MRIFKHIFIVLMVGSALFLAGHIIPNHLKMNPDTNLFSSLLRQAPKDTLAQVTPNPEDTLNLQEGLKQALRVIQVKKGRKNSDPDSWILGKGTSVPQYVLGFKQYLNSRGCKMIRAVESNKKKGSAEISWECPSDKDTSVVNITTGEYYLKNSSLISVIFEVEQFSPKTLNDLSELQIPFALLVNPFDTSRALFYDLDKLKSKELIIAMPMEPENYPVLNPGKSALYIHQTESEIKEITAKARKQFPTAIGFASRYGSQAIKHRPLLEAFIGDLAIHQEFFIDLTESQLSKAIDVCRQLGLTCSAEPLAKTDFEENYLNSIILKSRQRGSGIIILPLNAQNISLLNKKLIPIEEQGIQIVPVSEILNQ
jgi:polysaccharide deacetylase 2 family uncharacterized protein YibQ